MRFLAAQLFLPGQVTDSALINVVSSQSGPHWGCDPEQSSLQPSDPPPPPQPPEDPERWWLRPSRLGPSPLTTNKGSLASCSLSFTVTTAEPNIHIGYPVYVCNGSPEGCSGGVGSGPQSLLKVASLMRENAAPVSTFMSNGRLLIRTVVQSDDAAAFCVTTVYKVYSSVDVDSSSTTCVMCLFALSSAHLSYVSDFAACLALLI